MLKPKSMFEIPAKTRAVAKKVFSKGNTCLKLCDALSPVFEDKLFEDLYP